MSQIPKWSIKGDFIDSCNCNVVCVCNFPGSPPTDNHCRGMGVIHVREGRYGDVRLDGLTALFVSDFGEGIPWQTKWRAGFIIDAKGNSEQRQALQTIMSGQAGGPPKILAGFFEKVLGIEFAPIDFYHKSDGWGLSVGGKSRIEVTTDALKDERGNVTQIHNAPLLEVGHPATITSGRARASKIDAFGFRWDFTGQSSKHEPVDWRGP